MTSQSATSHRALTATQELRRANQVNIMKQSTRTAIDIWGLHA